MGKAVLVTGASRGIGASVASYFVDCGYHCLGTCASMRGDLDTRIEWCAVDFSSERSLESFLRKLSGYSFDSVINNAGINFIAPTTEYPSQTFETIISVNLIAPFRIIQEVVPSMLRKNFGRIVNVASIWGVVGKEHRSAYSASKAGLIGLTKSVAAEYASQGVLVNSVSPGFTDTELTRSILTTDALAALQKATPIGRLASTDEIAKAIYWLASDQNSYITGQNILVDGGFTSV